MSLQFEVIEDEEGCFVAACHEKKIYAEASNIEELSKNIHNAIEKHFGNTLKPNLKDIQLVFYKA